MDKLIIFCKNNFTQVYNFVRKLVFPLYLNVYRKNKLKKFKSPVNYHFSYLGQKFLINLNPRNGFIDQEIFVRGVYEPEILALIKKIVKKDDICIDVGANIADTALFISSIVGNAGRVICYEPIKSLVEQIRLSKDLNNFTNLTIINKALGNKKEIKTIYKNPINIGGSSLVSDNKDFDTEIIEISDGVELQHLDRVDFIKIDVEGYEWEAIQALKKIIQRFKPKLIFEFTIEAHGEGKIEILYFLQKENYSLFDIEENQKEIIDINFWYKNYKKIQTNILAI